MSTHSICFYGEIRKLFFNYHKIPSLCVPLYLQQENEQLSNKIDALEEKLQLQGKEIKSQNLEVCNQFQCSVTLTINQYP